MFGNRFRQARPAPSDDPAAPAVVAGEVIEPRRAGGRTPQIDGRKVMVRFVGVVTRIPQYMKLGWLLMNDPTVSPVGKAALGGGLAYAVSPIDAVPGIIPVLGQLDDLAVLLLAVRTALKSCPAEVAEARMAEAGLSWDLLERDLLTLRATTVWVATRGGALAVRLGKAMLSTAAGKLRASLPGASPSRRSGMTATVRLAEIEAAAERIRPYVRRTPLLELAQTVRRPLAWDVVLKLESLQVTGSFKPRGALNALLSLPRSEIKGGVVTASGGNHGLGVAYAARRLGVPATVYVPETAPLVKQQRIASWGAEVLLVGCEYAEAAAAAHDDAERNGKPYLHAYADAPIVAGQGTVALEFVEDAGAPPLDYLLIAIGGGGLIAGMATAVSEMPWLTVIGIEPEGAATLYEAWQAGGPVDVSRLDSFASDALGARRTGDLNYALARQHVARVGLVTDDDIRAAQRFLWEEIQLVAEPGGAAALAGLLSGKAHVPEGARVGVLVCGGNATDLPA